MNKKQHNAIIINSNQLKKEVKKSWEKARELEIELRTLPETLAFQRTFQQYPLNNNEKIPQELKQAQLNLIQTKIMQEFLYHDLRTNGLNALLIEKNHSVIHAISSLHRALYEQVFFEFEEQNIIRDNVAKELCYLIKSDMPSEKIYQELLNKVNQSSSD